MIKLKDLFGKKGKKQNYKIMDLGSFPKNKEFISVRFLNEDGDFKDFNILNTILRKYVEKSWYELLGKGLNIEHLRNDIYYLISVDELKLKDKERIYPIKK